jgi:carboxyl-terminal processing protease
MQNTSAISRKSPLAWACLVLLFCLVQGACRKDKSKPDYPVGSNEYVNSWILDSMKVYYYWNKTLPTKPNISLAPADFFSSILNQGDRFSRLVNPTLPESYYPSLVHNFGFDLAIYQESGNQIKTVLTLVVPQSQANLKSLQRGDIITKINGANPNVSTITSLILTAIKQRKITLEVEGKGTIEVGASIVVENPVYLYKTFNAGGKTIAYLFYNSFEARSKYALQEAFSAFRTQQATELIIAILG